MRNIIRLQEYAPNARQDISSSQSQLLPLWSSLRRVTAPLITRCVSHAPFRIAVNATLWTPASNARMGTCLWFRRTFNLTARLAMIATVINARTRWTFVRFAQSASIQLPTGFAKTAVPFLPTVWHALMEQIAYSAYMDSTLISLINAHHAQRTVSPVSMPILVQFANKEFLWEIKSAFNVLQIADYATSLTLEWFPARPVRKAISCLIRTIAFPASLMWMSTHLDVQALVILQRWISFKSPSAKLALASSQISWQRRMMELRFAILSRFPIA